MAKDHPEIWRDWWYTTRIDTYFGGTKKINSTSIVHMYWRWDSWYRTYNYPEKVVTSSSHSSTLCLNSKYGTHSLLQSYLFWCYKKMIRHWVFLRSCIFSNIFQIQTSHFLINSTNNTQLWSGTVVAQCGTVKCFYTVDNDFIFRKLHKMYINWAIATVMKFIFPIDT